uniref:Transcription factor domain-containing protein n=1 Tax=Fusarium oxysporum (strain Fo5176) TaxID=660025 RepID=A0A0D2Y1N8_FUSOF
MSAKTFNHVLYAKLYDHSQDLFANVFRRGSKSIEIVQAILILTYWKEPQDTRVWTSVGYAIRICMDLGWHKLTPYSPTAVAESEMQKRERRNVERTCLQTGRPWMIDCTEFIESIEDWCNGPLAIDNDQLLGAFTTLRLVTSASFPLLAAKSRQRSISLSETASLVGLLDGRIERWERKWTAKVTAQTEQSCHEFLIRFYGAHLRLQLHTLPLHGILVSDKSSALNMLQLISRFSEHVCFAQDSIHVMTAYSAAFLVKITLVFSDFISGQLESTCTEAIQQAAQVFSNQSGCISSSCTLQASFLERVAMKLTENQTRHKTPQEVQTQKAAHPPNVPPT